MMRNLSWTRLLFLNLFIFPLSTQALDIAITLDDYPMAEGPIFSLEKRTDAFIDSFKKHDIKAAFFCVGSHLKTKHDYIQLDRLDKAGHFLANHSMYHDHSSKKSSQEFKEELFAMNQILSPYIHFRKWYRFPYSDYGNRTALGGSVHKHLEFMKILKQAHYHEGYVTINTMDWSINQKLKTALAQGLEVNYEALKKAYLNLLQEWIRYYVNLYKVRYPLDNIKHTLLLHANDLNALFMDDIILMIKQQNWRIINPDEVFTSPSWGHNTDKKLNLLNIPAPNMKPLHDELNTYSHFLEKKN